MTPKLLLAALLFASAPCVFAQQGGPAPAGPAAPIARGHDHFENRDSRDDGERHGMHGGEMRGPMMHGMSEGAWWRNPEVASRIGLTDDQKKRIDEIFVQSRVQLIDLHASLEKAELLLEPLMNANPVDQAKAFAQISKIADTRADLEKTNAKMLLSIRAVLNAEQWTKLQDRHRGFRGGEMGVGDRGPRGPRNGQGPPVPPK